MPPEGAVWRRTVQGERAGGAHPSAWTTRRVARLGILSAVGTALFTLESLVPLPLPFLKIGLSNIATLLALILGGPADALIVLVARVLGGSLLTGSFLGPAFLLSISAGLTSTGVMCLLSVFLPGRRSPVSGILGPLGISLAGSTAHVVTQLAVVGLLFAGSSAVFTLLPVLLGTALAGGVIVGVAVFRILPALEPAAAGGHEYFPRQNIRPGDWVVAVALVAGFGASLLPSGSPDATAVTVEHHGRIVATLTLQEDRVLDVDGSRIQVRSGAVGVIASDCPNKVCIRTGWRSRAGDLVVCVPKALIVRIGGSRTPAAITG